MKSKHWLVLLIAGIWCFCYSGDIIWEWDKFIPGISVNMGLRIGAPLDMVTDSQGNIIIAGSTKISKVISDDKIIKNKLIKKKYRGEIYQRYPALGFIIKLDKNGKTLWYKSYEGHEELFGASLAVDKGDNIIFSYNYLIYTKSKYTQQARSESRYKIQKLSASGSVIWEKNSLQGKEKSEYTYFNNNLLIYDVAIGKDDKVYVCGRIGEDVTGHLFFTIYSSTGKVLKESTDDISTSLYMARICTDKEGNCFLAYFVREEGTKIDGYEYPLPINGSLNIVKFWSNGEVFWSKRLMGNFNGYHNIFDAHNYQMMYSKKDVMIVPDNRGGCLVWGLVLPGKDDKSDWLRAPEKSHPVIAFDESGRYKISKLGEIPGAHKQAGIYASSKETWIFNMSVRDNNAPPDFPEVHVVQKDNGYHYEPKPTKDKPQKMGDYIRIFVSNLKSTDLYDDFLNNGVKTQSGFQILKVCFISDNEFLLMGTCNDRNSLKYYPTDESGYDEAKHSDLSGTIFIYKGKLSK